MIAYFNGNYLSKDKICISPDDRGFLFSDGLYEVIRSYDGKLFKIQEHLERLSNGAKALHFNKKNFGYLAEVAKQLVQLNQLNQGEATVYIQVTRGKAPRSHQFPSDETPLTVYASAKIFHPKETETEKGVNIILVPDQRWSRCDLKTVSLIANIMANQKAKESGVAEAVFVRDGFIMEGTHSNIFAIFDNKVITPPKTNYILGGITRQVVLDICKKLSIFSKEQTIPESEISYADELMVVGTTTEITPVVRINGKIIGHGTPGPITRKLQNYFRETVDYMHCA